MGKKDFRGIEDFSPADVGEVFSLARTLKAEVKKGVFRPLLAGRGLAMIFEKPSLRTRSTFDLGMFQLGGHAIQLRPEEVGLGIRESVPDVARNLERWFDLIVARTFAQSTVDDLAAHCSRPVINALSDHEHPCQAMADFFTLLEHMGSLEKVRLGYVGDGNNMTHSLLLLGALTGAEVRAAAPEGYAPDPKLVARARQIHPKGGEGIWIGEDPAECLDGCNAVYTDVWASMGQEKEAEERARIFVPYQLNAALLARALPGAKVMHCLPAHRGLEITDEVIDGPSSIVYDQAENRLHVQKAIMAHLHHASGGKFKGWMTSPPATAQASKDAAVRRAPTIALEGRTVRRIPVRTHHITDADNIVEVAAQYAGPLIQAGDFLVMSEKVVAVTQGRAIPESKIRIGPLARVLWRFVTKSPYGIGLRSPATMQCAINECGGGRIFAAAIAGAIGKALGRRGDFYRIAGMQAATIDAAHTSPMQPDCVILGPRDPDGVAAAVADRLGCGAAIMDCNDIGGSWVLGASAGVDRPWLERAMAGNPLGQKAEQTPIGIVRIE